MTRLIWIRIIAAVVGVIADIRIFRTSGFVKRILTILAGNKAEGETSENEKTSGGDQVHEEIREWASFAIDAASMVF